MEDTTAPPELLTVAEATDYEHTSTHEEVLDFIETLEPLAARMSVQSMGESAGGQDIPVLVLSQARLFTPEAAQAAARDHGRPVVMILCNIHAGEVEGKEAALMLARDMTTGALGRLLSGATIVLVPNFNPDGNDRMDPTNRAMDMDALHGQKGPCSVGTRYTGTGINLNRDYTKQVAIESRLLSKLFGAWNPHVFVDSHTSNGSVHAYALTYDTSHTLRSGPQEPILYSRDTMLPAISASLERRTGMRTYFYGNFRDHDDPTQGWESYSPLPRYGSHYRGLTGRLDILLEAYSYAPFRDRVRVTYEIFTEILDYAAEHGREIVDVCDRAEADTVQRGRNPELDDLVGIRYGRAGRTARGDLRFRYPCYPLRAADIAAYDAESMRERRVPGTTLTHWPTMFHCRFEPEISVRRPRAYVFPARLRQVAEFLRGHNVVVRTAGEDAGFKHAECYLVLRKELTESPDVGDHERKETVFYVSLETKEHHLLADDFYVPMDQPLAALAIYLLEPHSDDGLARWGHFDDVNAGDEFPILRLPGAAVLAG